MELGDPLLEQNNERPVREKRFNPIKATAIKLKGISGAYLSLSSIEFFFYFAMATGGYLTVLLQKSGFEPAQVGIINAINSSVAICAMPFWGMISDKWRSIRKVILVCMLVAAVLWALVPLSSGIYIAALPLLYIVVPVSAFFRMPAQSLVDAFVVQTSAREGVAYGNVRLWGSISYAAMAFSLSAILPFTGVEASFYMYGLAFLPLIFIMLKMKGADSTMQRKKSVPFKEMQFGRLFKNYYFITYLIFSVFMHLPMNTSISFLPYLVDMVGGDTAQLGLVTGYKALLEVPMLLLMKPLRRHFPLPLAIVLACVLYVIEFSLYSSADSLLGIMLIQTLHGLAAGLMIGSAANYVFSLAPEGLNSTAHTLNGASNSLAAIIGNLLGGFLIGVVGIRYFYSLAAWIVGISVVYFIISLFIGIKVLKKPLPLLARSEVSREKIGAN